VQVFGKAGAAAVEEMGGSGLKGVGHSILLAVDVNHALSSDK